MGSHTLVGQFADYVRSLTPTQASVLPDKSIWRFAVTGRHAYRVVKALYGEATVALPRKWETARKILAEHTRFAD